MFAFEGLKVWQETKDLAKDIYQLLTKFPVEERHALCNQIRRAIISVSSNIAEGSGRISPKEQAHFYEIAYGSLMETYSQLLISQELGYISLDDLRSLQDQYFSIHKKLNSLRFSALATIPQKNTINE